jgi:hypothetical protein
VQEEKVMTKTGALLAGWTVLALAGAALGQSTIAANIDYSLAWEDTGNHNGLLEPGESAVLRMTATMTPPVGTVIPFTGGQGGPTGTLRAIAWGFIDLTGAGGTQGSFNLDPAAGYGTNPTWDLAGPSGYGTPNGTGLTNIQFGQFPSSSSGIMTTNPIVDVWTAAWTPSFYSARTVTFGTTDGTLPGPGASSFVVIKWGPLNGNLQAAACLSSFGDIQIPIVPAPSGLALWVLGGFAAGRRRGRRDHRRD